MTNAELQELAQTMPMPDLANYSPEQFVADIGSIKPRVFDSYIMPFFLIAFAIRSGSKKPLGKIARRMLFTAGVYTFYRNFANYQGAVQRLTQYFKPQESQNV